MSSSLKRKNAKRIVTRSLSKKQKFDTSKPVSVPEPEPNNNPVTEPKISKLSDLNEDCQIEIFRHCTIDDLVSAVEYDKKLSAAARWVFKQKVQDKFISLTNEIDTDKCNVPSTQVKMVKHFGDVFHGIKLTYDNDYHRFDHIIEKAINNRCHKTLRSLRIENVGRYSLFDIKKPFKNVRKLQFSGGTLNCLIPQIGKWFPNASNLRISKFFFPVKDKKKLAPKHCHALRELQIRMFTSIYSGDFAKWVTDFVVMNPQLTKLSLTFHAEMLNLLALRMPIMSNLHLEILPNHFHDGAPVHFEKLKKLTFRGQISSINVTADEIGTLDINLQWLMSDDLHNLFRRGTSINRLNIIHKWHADSNPDEIIERIKDIANIEELTLPAADTISTKEIVDLIGGCKTLKWILIHGDGEMADYPGLKKCLGAEWMVRRRNAFVNNVLKFGFEFQKF